MTDLDPHRFALRQADQAREDLCAGDGGTRSREGAAGPATDEQGPEDNVRVGSHRRRARHSLVGSVLSEGAGLTVEETIAVPACGWWALLALRALLTIWFATKD